MSVLKKMALCAVMSTILLSSQTYAQDTTNKVFIEGAIGQGKAEDFCTDIPPSLGAVNCEDSDTSLRVSGGIMLSNTVSLDVSYIDFGDTPASGSGSGVSFNAIGSASALALQAAIHAPVGAVSLFAKGGFAYTKVDMRGNIKVGSAFTSLVESDSAFKPIITFGLDLPISDKISFIGQYDRVFKAGDDNTTGETDLSSLSVGIKVNL